MSTLEVYLLDHVPFEDLLTWQRRMVYEVAGCGDRAILLLCEHEPLISVGREGSRADIRFDVDELRRMNWRIRWVNRGGGCTLHLPGQMAIYPILPLQRLGLNLPRYLDGLYDVMGKVVADANIRGASRDPSGIAVDGRLIAQVGVAVRNWVSYFGGVLNVNPDLEPFRRVDCGGRSVPMTSIERERRLAINPQLVRQRIVEHVQERFGFKRIVFRPEPRMGWTASKLVTSRSASRRTLDSVTSLIWGRSPEFFGT